jgi:hypothetical protein
MAGFEVIIYGRIWVITEVLPSIPPVPPPSWTSSEIAPIYARRIEQKRILEGMLDRG